MPEENNLKNRKVSWIVFTFVIGIIFIAFGYVFKIVGNLDGEVKATNNSITEIKMDIREIKTNVGWIMEAFKANQKSNK